MEAPGTTYRWVAGRGDARACANALFAPVLLRRRLWAVFGVSVVAWACVVWGSGAAPLVAVVFGVAWAVVVLAAVLGFIYAATRRRTRRQLAPGLALESEFADDSVVLRGTWTESRVAFAGIERIRRSGDWVLLRQLPSRMLSCWPAALFPDEELARVETAIAERS
jgi:hypothetical protein